MILKGKISLVLFFLSLACVAQINDQKNLLLHKTFGFIEGQKHTLNYIKKKFPKQKTAVLLAERQFKKTFNTSINKINYELKNIYGDEALKEQLLKVEKAFTKHFSLNNMSEQEASHYIEKVILRAKGNIKSPFLETLLNYQYRDNPVHELLENHTKLYSIVHHTGGKETEYTISIPQSWSEVKKTSDDSELKIFQSEYGTGNEFITIRKKPITQKGNNHTTRLATKNALKKRIPEISNIISIDQKIINNYLTSIVHYVSEEDNLKDVGHKKHIIEYSFSDNNSLLFIECTLYTNKEINDNVNYKKFAPLFQSITQSIKINNKYPTTYNLHSNRYRY